MDLNDFKEDLGIELNKETKIRSEKRYTVVVELVHKNKRYAFNSGTPIIDPEKAKESVLSKINFNITDDDLITFRCIEIIYATVPIETVLTGTKYEMQAIASKWLSPEELKSLIKS